jgi:hypothetical protein
MGRSMTVIIGALPADEQEAIKIRCQDLKQDEEGLWQIAYKAQAEIIFAHNINQPSVSRSHARADRRCS